MAWGLLTGQMAKLIQAACKMTNRMVLVNINGQMGVHIQVNTWMAYNRVKENSNIRMEPITRVTGRQIKKKAKEPCLGQTETNTMANGKMDKCTG